MKMKTGFMVLALFLMIGSAAADHTLEHEVKSHDGRNLTYNISDAGSPTELGEDANSYVPFTGLGVLAIVWIVFYSIPNRKGYPSPDCMISANFITSGISLFIFPMGWIQGEAVAFMIVALGGSLAYKRMRGPRF